MIEHKTIDEAIDYYNIDTAYRQRCHECADRIKNSGVFSDAFDRVYKELYLGDMRRALRVWSIRDVNELFSEGIDPFVTNLMIVAGYEMHISNMRKCGLDPQQTFNHKAGIKGAFESDLKKKGRDGVRIGLMVWAVLFIRVRILEIGRLQFEYADTDDGHVVKIHIPGGEKLDIESVVKSIEDSKKEIERLFGDTSCDYVCHSWLLSNRLFLLLDQDSNIYRFHQLFDVTDGKNCNYAVLDFLFNTEKCEDYSALLENTSLQKKVKQVLLDGEDFYEGRGFLKN